MCHVCSLALQLSAEYFVVIFLVSSVSLAPNVAPSDVGGGGGSNRELTITWMVSIACAR